MPIARSLAAALCCALVLAVGNVRALAQNASEYELALVDMRGKKKVLGTLPGSVFAPRLSPDGKRVAFELNDAEGSTPPRATRLWIAELAHLDERHALPLVGKGANWAPIWTPDGTRLVFLVSGERPDALYWRRADGSDQAEHLLDARAAEGLYAGGQQLAFITLTGNRDYGVALLDMTTRSITRLVDYPGSEQHSSRISPDGRWLAYVSNETGRQEVWLEPLPQTGKRYRVTQTGGRHPLWSPDGRFLYFDQDLQIFRIEMFTGSEAPKVSDPKALPIKGFQQGDLRRQYDLTPDGRQFLMLFPLKPSAD